MFSGIVQSIGKVIKREQQVHDCRLHFSTPAKFMDALSEGNSVAVNGVCLTIIQHDNETFSADVSAETLRCTTLSMLNVGNLVNLEPALCLGDSVNGHFVNGHVDGVGTVLSCVKEGESTRVEIEAPEDMVSFIVPKGAICVDGVSLTANTVDKTRFQINLIPYTTENTILLTYKKGSIVNLEVDLIARYVAQQLAGRRAS